MLCFPLHWHRLTKRLTNENNTITATAPDQITTKPTTPTLIEKPNEDVAIFVVEDNPVNQKVISSMLKKLGFKPTLANNGQEALDQLATGYQPDIILMDCQMPVMDGYTATRTIREEEAHKQIQRTPIIATTANAMVGDREQCLEADMDKHLAKPITLKILTKALQDHGILASN